MRIARSSRRSASFGVRESGLELIWSSSPPGPAAQACHRAPRSRPAGEEAHPEEGCAQHSGGSHKRRNLIFNDTANADAVQRHGGRAGAAVGGVHRNVIFQPVEGMPAAWAASWVSTTDEAPVSSSMGTVAPLSPTRTAKSPSAPRATSTTLAAPGTAMT